MEHFYTLQGEGRYSGQASYFIRLGGCDVGCTWCDVKESWDATKHPQVTIEDIVNVVRVSGSPIAVITGGEPLMHNLNGLTTKLKSIGVRTHIETSGAHPLSGSWDWICLSPKKFKAPLEEVIKRANELKVVVYNKSDLEWAEKYAALVSPDCLLYLQPEWSKASVMNSLIVSYIKENPKWIFSSQSHKFLDIP
ncbi:MAG: 7-carboxy-7-deazaguanine synthase QueE [Chitinophagaceae bacterium]|nr:MAG: 7-carboxy-7-deazaguanine synthase QueE [Chitinophagaceae bacterium]